MRLQQCLLNQAMKIQLEKSSTWKPRLLRCFLCQMIQKINSFQLCTAILLRSNTKATCNQNCNWPKPKYQQKKDLYHKAVDGKVPLDSTTFNNFISNYNHSYYDQKLLYHFITNKPELFFLEINLFAVEQDVAFCSECFTKEDLDEMYCKLKPFKSKDPHKLWMFERLREYKCPQDWALHFF